MSESIGVGHRAGYYDRAGVLRDMLQNHLLQLLTLTAMEPPSAFNARALRDEKVKVLQAVRPIGTTLTMCWGSMRVPPGRGGGAQTPPRRLMSRSSFIWTTGAGRGCHFICAPARIWRARRQRSRCSSGQCRTCSFPRKADWSATAFRCAFSPTKGMHLLFQTKRPGAGMRSAPVDMEFHYSDDFGEH